MDTISETLAKSLCDVYKNMLKEIITESVSYEENSLTYTLKPKCHRSCSDKINVDFTITRGKKLVLDMKNINSVTADKVFKVISHDGMYTACMEGDPPKPVEGKCGGNIAQMLAESYLAMSKLDEPGHSEIKDGDRTFKLESEIVDGVSVITFSIEVLRNRERYETVRLVGVTNIAYTNEVLIVSTDDQSFTITDLKGVFTDTSMDWDGAKMYEKGSVCMYNGIMYRSIQKEGYNYNHEPTDKNWWKQIGGRNTVATSVVQYVGSHNTSVFHGLDTESVLVSVIDVDTGTFVLVPHSLATSGSRNAIDFTFPESLLGKEYRFNIIGIDEEAENFAKWSEYEETKWVEIRKVTWQTMRAGVE